MTPEGLRDKVGDLIKKHKKGTSIGFSDGIDPLDSIVHITTVKGPPVRVENEHGPVYISGETMVFNTEHGLEAISGGSLREITLKNIKKLFPKKEYEEIRKAVKDNLKKRAEKKMGR